MMQDCSKLLRTFLAAAICVLGGGCTPDVFLNQTASVGGDIAGNSGTVDVAFINNTPFRAIFTYGTYNNTDEDESPNVAQFIGDVNGLTLEGDQVANIVSLPCNRVFSIGDSELLRLLDRNGQVDGLNAEALVPGAAFSSAALGDDNDGLATEGFAPELRALLGVDFPCGSIIVIRYEIDDAGPAPFRMDFEVIPPSDDQDRGV